MPRLVGSGDWLSRLGGGIGTRGPGETKLETDRRHIRHRISVIGKQIADVKAPPRAAARSPPRRPDCRRSRWSATPTPARRRCSTGWRGRKPLASDALFVTLDPLLRQVRLADGPQILLSDTVGFIDRLPHSLVAAFRATLEEVAAGRSAAARRRRVRSRPRAAHRSRRARARRDRGARGAARSASSTRSIGSPTTSARASRRGRRRRRLRLGGRRRRASTTLEREVTPPARARHRARHGSSSTPRTKAHQARIARLYRHARVLSHEAAAGRIAIEADVPRRLAGAARGRPRGAMTASGAVADRRSSCWRWRSPLALAAGGVRAAEAAAARGRRGAGVSRVRASRAGRAAAGAAAGGRDAALRRRLGAAAGGPARATAVARSSPRCSAARRRSTRRAPASATRALAARDVDGAVDELRRRAGGAPGLPARARRPRRGAHRRQPRRRGDRRARGAARAPIRSATAARTRARGAAPAGDRGAGRARRAPRGSAAISTRRGRRGRAPSRRRRTAPTSCASWPRSSARPGSSTPRSTHARAALLLDDGDAGTHALVGELESARGNLRPALEAYRARAARDPAPGVPRAHRRSRAPHRPGRACPRRSAAIGDARRASRAAISRRSSASRLEPLLAAARSQPIPLDHRRARPLGAALDPRRGAGRRDGGVPEPHLPARRRRAPRAIWPASSA